MKYFIALFAVILVASAMPTDIGSEANDIVNNVVDIGIDGKLNGSRAWLGRNTGLAGFGSGTRGGQGGAVWTVWDPWALRDALAGNDPRIVYVRGRIDVTPLFTGSPGIAIPVGNFKSIIGGDSSALITGGGLSVTSTRQVIIQNLRIYNALSYNTGERPDGNGGIIGQIPGAYSRIDNIVIERSEYVWVDHCELADDPWNAATLPADRRRHDGLIDIVMGSNYISISNTIFRNHNHVGLVGNSDFNGAMDGPALKVTYYLNWFRGTNQRHPRVRFGSVHMLNNLYTDITFYGIGVGTGSSIFVERNVFVNSRRTWVIAEGPAGTPPGNLATLNNQFRNSAPDSGIPSNVNWRPEQFYGYNPMSVNSVENHVRRFAGTW